MIQNDSDRFKTFQDESDQFDQLKTIQNDSDRFKTFQNESDQFETILTDSKRF